MIQTNGPECSEWWELGRNLATFNLALLICKIKRSYGFCFGIEVVMNFEGAFVFCIAIIAGGEDPRLSTVQNTQARSEFLTTSIPKQKQ